MQYSVYSLHFLIVPHSYSVTQFIKAIFEALKEQVELLEINDFIALFSQANLQLVDLFGDYQLQAYDKELSNRQILIFQ